MSFRTISLSVLAGIMFVSPNIASATAYVNAYSNVIASTLQIAPAVGTVEFNADPQYLNVSVSSLAQNSLGDYDPESSQGNAFTNLSAGSFVTWANSHGEANNSTQPYSTASVAASSAVNIPLHTKMQWAYGQGNGSLGQWFGITGGTGTTDTTLSLQYSGNLYGSAGDDSSFITQIIARFELWDANGNQISQQLGNNVVSGGPNETKSVPIPVTTLSDTVTLSYNTWYWVYFEGDSETHGQVPEPASILLTLSGLMQLAHRRMRTSA